MKRLTLVIRAEFDVPDDWNVVAHSSGIQALEIGDRYISFDLVPFETTSKNSDAEWSDAPEELIESILDAVASSESELEIMAQH